MAFLRWLTICSACVNMSNLSELPKDRNWFAKSRLKLSNGVQIYGGERSSLPTNVGAVRHGKVTRCGRPPPHSSFQDTNPGYYQCNNRRKQQSTALHCTTLHCIHTQTAALLGQQRCLVASATSNRDDQQSTYPWCLECQINHFFAAFGLGTGPIAPRAATAVAAAMRILRHVWRFFHSMYTSIYVHTCMPIGTLIR